MLLTAVTWARSDGKTYAYTSLLHELGSERWGMEQRAVDEDISALMDSGYLFFERSVAGIGDFHLKQAGFDAAGEFERLRSNPRKRAIALRDLLLGWIYEETLRGVRSPVLNKFLDSGIDYYGSSFTERELYDASRHLRDEDYITGMAAHGAGVIRPQITLKGRYAVEQERSVSAPQSSAVSYTVNANNSRGFNMMVDSVGSSQSNTIIEINVDEARKVAEAFRSMIPIFGLPEEQLSEARSTSDELDIVLESDQPEPNKVRQLVNKATEVAALGTTSGVVQAFVEMARSFLESI